MEQISVGGVDLDMVKACRQGRGSRARASRVAIIGMFTSGRSKVRYRAVVESCERLDRPADARFEKPVPPVQALGLVAMSA